MFAGHSFAYVEHFVFLKDVWIRTQRAVVANIIRLRMQILKHSTASQDLPCSGAGKNLLPYFVESLSDERSIMQLPICICLSFCRIRISFWGSPGSE